MGWGGFLLIVGVFVCIFGVLENKNNDDFWKDRTYTLVEKHMGAHEYKGRVLSDHYVTIQYSDEPNTLWTREESGADYYSMKEGRTYTERGPKDEKLMNKLFLGLMLLGFAGVIFLSVSLANSMSYD